MSGDTYDWTNAMHPEAYAAALGTGTIATNATPSLTIGGQLTFHSSIPSTEATVHIFKDAADNWYAKPVPVGFEGQGAKGFDGVEASELMNNMVESVLSRIDRDLKGHVVANAISALHDQHRSDGRPVPFLPELE